MELLAAFLHRNSEPLAPIHYLRTVFGTSEFFIVETQGLDILSLIFSTPLLYVLNLINSSVLCHPWTQEGHKSGRGHSCEFSASRPTSSR